MTLPPVKRVHEVLNMIVFGIIVASTWWSLTSFSWYNVKYQSNYWWFGIDARILWHAANGEEDWDKQQWWYLQDHANGYIWRPFVAKALSFVALVPEEKFVGGMCWLVGGCYLILVWQLLKVNYGWAIALITLRGAMVPVLTGNLSALLCVLAISPWLAVLVILVKPHLAVYVAGHAIARRYGAKSV